MIKIRKVAFIYLMVISATSLFVVEVLNRMSIIEVVNWAVHNPAYLVINYLLILFIYLILFVLFNNRKFPYIFISCLFWLISLISGIKLKLLGVPLLPNDITLIKEATDISQYLGQIYNSENVFIIIVSLLSMFIPILFIPNGGTISKKKRISFSAASIGIIMLLICFGPQFLYKIGGVGDIRESQSDNYRKNGLITAYLANIKSVKIETPHDYSLEIMKNIKDKYSANQNIQISTPKANIILILSESLWDMTQVKNLELSSDPLEFYHSLAKDYTSGQMVSPQFGGGTVNVEFEVLTGNSMRFLTQGALPFLQFNREIDSIASILSRQGYYTTAISSYLNWYYNVRTTYQNLGFNQFISSEFLKQEIRGYYISDDVFMDAIIKQTESTEGYDFIYAKSMETHFPYDDNKFDKHEISVLSPKISDESKSIIETYAQGVHNFDKALEKLINFFNESEEPTIVVVFGDHLPVLGDNHGVYKELGYIDDNEISDKEKLYQTPILIWNNFKEDYIKEELQLNATYVAPYILNYAGVTGTAFTNYLWDTFRKEKKPLNLIQNIASHHVDYKTYVLFEYDNLFGKQHVYSLENSKNNIRKSDYFLGFEAPEIDGVQIFINHKIGSSLSMTGSNFSQQSVVTLNGVELKTSYLDENKLNALLPDSSLHGQSDDKFQVLIKDNKGTILSKSIIYYLK